MSAVPVFNETTIESIYPIHHHRMRQISGIKCLLYLSLMKLPLYQFSQSIIMQNVTNQWHKMSAVPVFNETSIVSIYPIHHHRMWQISGIKCLLYLSLMKLPLYPFINPFIECDKSNPSYHWIHLSNSEWIRQISGIKCLLYLSLMKLPLYQFSQSIIAECDKSVA